MACPARLARTGFADQAPLEAAVMKVSIVNRLSERGDGAANDDAIGWRIGSSEADFWVIDGATSVADQAYVPRAQSDPAWFAESLSSTLAEQGTSAAAEPEILLRNALASVRRRYAAAVGDIASVPVYAWPLASITFVRVSQAGRAIRFAGTCLGDCPAFVSDGRNWSAFWQPQVHGDQPSYLSGSPDRAEMKERIRRRRAEQHAKPGNVAGLDPDCVDHAGQVRFEAGKDAGLVLMSDGFARLFQDYRLASPEEVMRELETEGAAEALYARLREAEAHDTRAQPGLYKGGDDATVLAVRFDSE
jgi:hypothetical protein